MRRFPRHGAHAAVSPTHAWTRVAHARLRARPRRHPNPNPNPNRHPHPSPSPSPSPNPNPNSRQAEAAPGIGSTGLAERRVAGVPHFQEAEARAAVLQAQIGQHQQSVMSDALEVEQRLNEARITLTPTPAPTPTLILTLTRCS